MEFLALLLCIVTNLLLPGAVAFVACALLIWAGRGLWRLAVRVNHRSLAWR